MNLMTSHFKWVKEERLLKAWFEHKTLPRFPRVLYITSDATGKTIRFEQNTAEAIEAEYWDGEMMSYISPDSDIEVLISYR